MSDFAKDKITSPLSIIILVVFIFTAFNLFVFDIMVVEGHSMEPTIKPGQLIFIYRLEYGFLIPFLNKYIVLWNKPKKDEIVVLKSPEEGKVVVKRCITVSGDNVFLIGDNKSKSIDSRFYGFVSIYSLLGKVIGF